jgi:hypothetical protein
VSVVASGLFFVFFYKASLNNLNENNCVHHFDGKAGIDPPLQKEKKRSRNLPMWYFEFCTLNWSSFSNVALWTCVV